MMHAFRALDQLLLLDVESGAVHICDEPSFLVVQAVELGKDPYEALPDKPLADEILAELDELKKLGMADTAQEDAEPLSGGHALKSMCLHVAHDCNLRCKYCFGSAGEFHGERMLMSVETAKKAIDFLMKASGSRKHLEVDLFGGEPLLNYSVCKETVAYGRAQEEAFGKQINFTMTTNCVALNDERIAFLNREMHNIVISLDGRQSVHDAMRPTADGRGSHATVLKNAKRLIEARRGEYYARGTFTRDNLDFTEDVKALAEEGFSEISVEPVVLADDSPFAILPEMIPQICDEYDRLAVYYQSKRDAGEPFHFFHFNIDLSGGPCLRKRISGCGAGLDYCAVAPNGDIYPCHQFVGLPEWRMGNVSDGVVNAEIPQRFAACTIRTKARCADCWAKYYCSGGCMANAYLMNGDIMQPHETSCAMLRKRTECAIALHVKNRT